MLPKNILGLSAVIIGFMGYAPYLRDLFKGTTKPHFFSWFLWGIIEIIAFIAQVNEGAGPGAWVTGFSALIVCFIALKALLNGEKNITKLDWFGFVGAFIGIAVWIFTKDPTGAVIVVSATDALAFVPTYRKGFERPYEETLIEYALSSVKHFVGILALQSYSLATYFYPASLVLTNGAFTIMVWLRRKKLAANAKEM